MKFKGGYYLIIPLVVIAVSAVGGLATTDGLAWYDTLTFPSYTPPGSVIGMVWTVLYILAAIAAIRVWSHKPKRTFKTIALTFGINAGLNVLWSELFFGLHFIGLAALDAFLLGVSVVALIALLWKHDRVAAGLLIPYAAWVFFATALNIHIFLLNF